MKILNKLTPLKNQLGFSLVELMVAMFLSLIMIAGMINLYSSNKVAYKSQESVSRIQEAYRFASEKIQKELRSGGYYGCNNESPMVDTLSSLPFVANYEKPIEGFDATDMTTWDRSITSTGTGLTMGTATGDVVRGGTDILVVRRGSDTQYPIVTPMTTTTSNLQIQANMPTAVFADNDVVIVSDCTRSAIFQVTNFSRSAGTIQHATSGGNIGNSTNQLLTSAPGFDLDASVMRLDTVIYFIGTEANGTPSLKRKINNDASQTIVSGVENMQVVYGLDTDATGVANRYVNASNITAGDWINVTSARIALLMSSAEGLLSDPDTADYDLLDQAIVYTGGPGSITHAGDSKFRQVVQMTVDVRNIGI